MNRWLCFLLLTMVLSGCITARADELPAGARNAPEDAVFEQMKNEPATVTNNLAIRQVAQLDKSLAPVLVSYWPEGWTYAQPALALFVIEQDAGRWVVRSHAYSDDPTLIDEVFTFYSPELDAPRALSAVYGLVADERVVQVAVVWEDGAEEQVSVANGTYLSLRTDAAGLRATKVTALDAQGAALTEHVNAAAQP